VKQGSEPQRHSTAEETAEPEDVYNEIDEAMMM
jgi:hypothetical protein